MARLLDPLNKATGKFPFEYRNSANTDVRVTWQRARDAMKQNAEEVKAKVKPMKKATNGMGV